jgi:basic amino acid/polyamine antiporter, APA family
VTQTGVKREIGIVSSVSIVVANIVGAGIFTTSGILAGLLPAARWVMACWFFGGVIAITGALCYSELATRMPQAGGEYVYLKRLYHPALGFLTGWTSFIVGFSAAIAASSMGFSEYFFSGFDDKFLAAGSTQLIVVKKLTAVTIIAAFTALHYRGVRAGTRVQNTLTVIKIVIVLGLATTGLLLGGNRELPAVSGEAAKWHWTAVGTAMMLVMFAYSGWNASAYIAEELKNPKRTLPVSLIAGTGIVILLYVAVNLFIFRSLPYEETKGVVAIMERASVGVFGDWMGRGLGILVSVALLSSLSAYIIIGPRVYFAMARDRLFFRFASVVHPKYYVPGWSIVIQGALAAMMVLIGSFEQLLIYLGFALGIFPWMAVAGIFIARKRKIGEETAIHVPGYPVVPVFFLLITLTLMVIAFINRPFESTAAILTVLAGVPCYFLRNRFLSRD